MSTPVRVVIGVTGPIADGQEYLIGRRKGKAYHGCWEFPGGKVEAGETPEEALVREWMEELGVEITVGGLLFENRFTTVDLVDFQALAYEVRLSPGSHIRLDRATSHDKLRHATKDEILALQAAEVTPSLWPITQALA